MQTARRRGLQLFLTLADPDPGFQRVLGISRREHAGVRRPHRAQASTPGSDATLAWRRSASSATSLRLLRFPDALRFGVALVFFAALAPSNARSNAAVASARTCARWSRASWSICSARLLALIPERPSRALGLQAPGGTVTSIRPDPALSWRPVPTLSPRCVRPCLP